MPCFITTPNLSRWFSLWNAFTVIRLCEEGKSAALPRKPPTLGWRTTWGQSTLGSQWRWYFNCKFSIENIWFQPFATQGTFFLKFSWLQALIVPSIRYKDCFFLDDQTAQRARHLLVQLIEEQVEAAGVNNNERDAVQGEVQEEEEHPMGNWTLCLHYVGAHVEFLLKWSNFV